MRSALRLSRLHHAVSHPARRFLSTTSQRTSASSSSSSSPSSPFASGPSPPRLPKEEQELFEKLQRQSTGAFSNPQPSTPSSSSSTTTSPRFQINQSPDSDSTPEQIEAEPGVVEVEEGDELHPHMRRGAPPEFEGDVNPKTGEVGGPKNEPLRWGSAGDWSFNGRVTDF
ncbi:DUF1674-domain-containing protein [Aaosphaeria arxii CBS 175.79]|uniref:Succinate dehydrogenase assembly factor 4, mitochondrial n=1 Tax=Aaosphaeria arxii CBS 175.79 TaxID=1450172 RepID=A0A6A5XV79_9PLEO|nr:DUF1674-domain-containing protein [Aaosphaeria arxii CBS 175.79]KAF2016859.1 DUF1674-domain-containing protein [Aaosphaeria arxii CBS 175.79]